MIEGWVQLRRRALVHTASVLQDRQALVLYVQTILPCSLPGPVTQAHHILCRNVVLHTYILSQGHRARHVKYPPKMQVFHAYLPPRRQGIL